MNYRFVILQTAIDDTLDIVDHLNQQKEDLGDRFLDDLEDCYSYLRLFPFGFQIRKGRYRHGYLKVFPMRVIYEVEDGSIFIYRIRHTSRRESERFGP